MNKDLLQDHLSKPYNWTLDRKFNKTKNEGKNVNSNFNSIVALHRQRTFSAELIEIAFISKISNKNQQFW